MPNCALVSLSGSSMPRLWSSSVPSSFVNVTAHLIVLLEVPVVVSHPRLAAAFSVKSVKSPGIKDRRYSETAEVVTHGVPKKLNSNNGKESHMLQRYLTNMGIKYITNKSAEDPEVTGLVEAFMHHLKKIFHTAGVEREDPYLRLNNYLMQFRATPHATMRKCLAELLFRRKFVTKLPDMRIKTTKARKDIMEAKEDDRRAKYKMKKYKDTGRPVREHGIVVRDLVISKRKITKHNSAYDPKPYKVVATYSTQIKDLREDGKYKTGDSQKQKQVQVQDRRSYGEVERPCRYLDETDIGAGIQEGEGRGRVMYAKGWGTGWDMYAKGEGAGRHEQGHDSDGTNSESEGAGRDVYAKGKGGGVQEQGHDSDSANSEGEGAGRVVYAKGEGAGRDVFAKGEGGRRRAASETSSSTSSSRSNTSVKATMERRRRQSGRQDDVLEQHRHWSVSGVAGAGAQRAGAREAAPRYNVTWRQGQEGDGGHDDDEDANAAANDEGKGEEGADDDQDGEAAAESRPDIQARLRRAPGVIVANTWAKRPQRTRAPTDIYQAGTEKRVKKPGRGRGK